MVEKVGSGINRMREEMLAANLPEPEFSLEGMFTVTFYRPLKFSDWIITIQEMANRIQIAILTQINANQSVTIREIAHGLNMSIRTVERNVAKLKEIGFLIRIGSDKDGYYEIHKKRF
jgi:ATP-dependent DNA helicase RecG